MGKEQAGPWILPSPFLLFAVLFEDQQFHRFDLGIGKFGYCVFQQSAVGKKVCLENVLMKVYKVDVFKMTFGIANGGPEYLVAEVKAAPMQPLCYERCARAVHARNNERLVFHSGMLR